MFNQIIVKRNQEVVEHYMAETATGFKYAVLVKISGYNGVEYGFVTTSGQASKTYKTQRGMRNWVAQSVTDWQQITTDFHKAKCLEKVRKLGE